MGTEGEDRAAFGTRTAELATAVLFFVLGALVVYDSLRLGAGWAEDGPQAGYFPFYIGALICVASVVNFALAIVAARRGDRAFVEAGQLKLVLAVLVPTIIYVVAIAWMGIYVASAIFVAYFMRRLGQYAWWKVAAVALGNSVFFFLVFEVWFKIPLPKGPLEAWLGLN
jgi:hypothetical protein